MIASSEASGDPREDLQPDAVAHLTSDTQMMLSYLTRLAPGLARLITTGGPHHLCGAPITTPVKSAPAGPTGTRPDGCVRCKTIADDASGLGEWT